MDRSILLKLKSEANPSDEMILEAARFIGSDDPDTLKEAVTVITEALNRIISETERVRELLSKIEQSNPESENIIAFVHHTRKTYEEILNRAYEKIIRPTSGTPCCPRCGSSEIGEIDGVYEFGLMNCFACGHQQWCDVYEEGDWYR